MLRSLYMAGGRVARRRRNTQDSPGAGREKTVGCRTRGSAPTAWRGILATLLSVFVLAPAGLPPVAQAGTRQELQVSLTILPAQDTASLPEVVRRLEAVRPGYGDHWAHARSLAATEPLQAVRSLRRIHASMLERPGARALESDMAAAGQALFRPASEGVVGATRAGS